MLHLELPGNVPAHDIRRLPLFLRHTYLPPPQEVPAFRNAESVFFQVVSEVAFAAISFDQFLQRGDDILGGNGPTGQLVGQAGKTICACVTSSVTYPVSPPGQQVAQPRDFYEEIGLAARAGLETSP